MAGSGDGTDTWPGFIAQVNNTFNLLRDVFGYALPGGVFLSTGLLSKRFALSDVENLLRPYHPPTWAAVILVIGACYIVGDIMAATVYMPVSLLKWLVWEMGRLRTYVIRPWVKDWVWFKKWDKTREKAKWFDDKMTIWWKDWLEQNPTEVSAELLKIRFQRKELFLSLDRRETLSILAGSTAAALLCGWFVFFHAQWDAGTILRWAGIIIFVQFLTGISHLRRVGGAIRKADAALTAETPKPATPDFNQPLAGLFTAACEVTEAAKAAFIKKG
jgi:hypothetical protein